MALDDQGEAHITFSALCRSVVEGVCQLLDVTLLHTHYRVVTRKTKFNYAKSAERSKKSRSK
jgi:hypothetical protein